MHEIDASIRARRTKAAGAAAARLSLRAAPGLVDGVHAFSSRCRAQGNAPELLQ